MSVHTRTSTFVKLSRLWVRVEERRRLYKDMNAIYWFVCWKTLSPAPLHRGVKRSGPVTEPRCWREFRFSDSSAGCLPAQSSSEGLFIKPPLYKSSLERRVQMITAEGYSRLNQTYSSTATNRLNKCTFSVFIFKLGCPFYILGFWKRSCFG